MILLAFYRMGELTVSRTANIWRGLYISVE